MGLFVRRCFGLLLLTAIVAEGSLASVRQAQALLGPETWTRALRIENAGKRSGYPKIVYALVFELQGILWFYSDTDGTQSLSIYRGRVTEDKTSLGALLPKIDPGFTSFTVLADQPAARILRGGMPNGCFIESLARGRALAREGKVLGRPQLVAYYSPQRVAGHCVLAYETAQGIFIVDSEASPRPRWVGRRWPEDLAALIRASRPELKALSSVRSFPLELPVRPAVAATAESRNDREKG